MNRRLALVAALSAVVPIPAVPSEQPAAAALEARRLSAPLTLDGRLDEPAWHGVQAATSFEQIIPDQGGAPAWPTSVRVLFDQEFLYFGFEVGDQPGRRPRVTDLRRDFDYDESDLVGVFLDPFGEGRLGWGFQVTPLGTLRDLQITDGERIDQSWDALWAARVATTPSGWSVEMAIPWKSLRYPEATLQSWRVNFQRRLRADNQLVGWSPWPRSLNPYRTELAGTVTGLEPPRPSRNLRLTPAVVGRGRDDADGWSSTADLSADVKWVPRPDLVLDATINTDFAETEVDEQVVNLNRYSVFLPEKRSFFLEILTESRGRRIALKVAIPWQL